MSATAYQDFMDGFSPELIEAELQGSRAEGFNVCTEICDRWADSGKVALRHQSTDGTVSELTFAELKVRAAQFANYLSSQGIGKGDRVACLLPRTPQLLIVVLGTLRAGAVYQPLFTAFGSGAIEYRTEKAGTRLIVTDEANRHKLNDVNNCPPVLMVSDNPSTGEPGFVQSVYSQSEQFEPVIIGEDDPFLQMFTSGTVGKSKGVHVPAKALLAFHVYMKYAIGLQDDDTYWNVADPGWAYGLYYAVVGPLLLGCTTHFNEAGFTAQNTFDFLRQHKITNLAAAPTAYRMLMANDHLLGETPEPFSLRVGSSAGEPLNPEVINWIDRRLACPVMDHYGQTETGMTACNHHALKHKIRIGSMGYSMPGYRVVALNGNFEEVGEGETGQLAVDMDNSPLFFFQGYTWNEKQPYCGKYYLTGDVVEAHGDGAFTFAGRDDDIITSAGYRIGPADVESTLIEHGCVAESGVVAKPDAERGSIVKAYVVLKQGYDASDELADELKQFVRKRLSTHAFPREIEFVDDLPKTPSGKIQRFMLRQQAEQEV
ncbi:MAG TPA: AMP-binding protein [Motiliproteus sp.]